jgi:nitrite reductase/ring-hydroxylating ferredoxin subunit
MNHWINAGTLEALQQEGAKVIKGGIAVFYHEEQVYALDNRCPHMGFPLQLGSLCDGILTCHWHHARFDVCSGGTFDPWADDVPTYPVQIESNEIWVNPEVNHKGGEAKLFQRLQEGLEQNISLVIAKAVVGLMEANVSEIKIAQAGIQFGTSHRPEGWGSGLTILTAMVNVLPKLDKYGRFLALFQGLVHVARDSAGRGTKFMLQPLPGASTSPGKAAKWYRQCIEVRDSQGAERNILTSIENGMDDKERFETMMIAVTDHFFLDGGHTLDFHNKAFEWLGKVEQAHINEILTSLVPLPANARRSEELHSWQSPVNLVEPLHEAFKKLSDLPKTRSQMDGPAVDEETILNQILSDRPIETIEYVTKLLKQGYSPIRLARIIALAAAERIARFHTQNEFGDWITVLHTFTHAHAVHESLLRSEHPLILRAMYYSIVSIYLDRFLNIPAAAKPKIDKSIENLDDPEQLLNMLNQQQQVSEAGNWVASYLAVKGDIPQLFNTLGHALLREDAEFHSFQMYEAAGAEFDHWSESSSSMSDKAKETLLLAVTRYLSAHAPTSRTLPNTARIAWRLYRGERLFEENE